MTTSITTEVFGLNNVFQKTAITGSWVSDATITTNQAAGWVAGGYSAAAISTVQKITYATDTATASVRGSLGRTDTYPTGITNTTNGWAGGGGGPVSTVLGITYATDTAVATVRTNLLLALVAIGGVSNTTNGWFCSGGTATNVVGNTTIQGITFATDTLAPTNRGTLAIPTMGSGTGVGNYNNGWFGGGAGTVAAAATSNVQAMTYATDTNVASIRGSLAIATIANGTTTNTTNGWFAACGNGGSLTSVQWITFATDTTVASVRGNLVTGTASVPGGIGNATNGWVAGGSPSTPISNVQGITYATDTTVASQRGKLSTVTMEAASL